MKLAIVQLVQGVLTVASAVLFSAGVMPGYWCASGVVGPDRSIIVNVFGNPGRNTVMETWLWCYLALALAILVVGIAFSIGTGRNARLTLATAQTVLGAFVVAALVVYMVWLEPGWVPHTKFMENVGEEVVVRHDPGWVMLQLFWKAASLVVGLGVTGLGLMQWRRLRKKTVSPSI